MFKLVFRLPFNCKTNCKLFIFVVSLKCALKLQITSKIVTYVAIGLIIGFDSQLGWQEAKSGFEKRYREATGQIREKDSKGSCKNRSESGTRVRGIACLPLEYFVTAKSSLQEHLHGIVIDRHKSEWIHWFQWHVMSTSRLIDVWFIAVLSTYKHLILCSRIIYGSVFV